MEASTTPGTLKNVEQLLTIAVKNTIRSFGHFFQAIKMVFSLILHLPIKSTNITIDEITGI